LEKSVQRRGLQHGGCIRRGPGKAGVW